MRDQAEELGEALAYNNLTATLRIAPIQGPDGNLYGVTTSGGANDAGVFYKITR